MGTASLRVLYPYLKEGCSSVKENLDLGLQLLLVSVGIEQLLDLGEGMEHNVLPALSSLIL